MMDITRENGRLQAVFGLPLEQRCEELIRIMNECTFKEMQMVYPLILESIFGSADHCGWGLHSIYKNQSPHEYEIIYHFLRPYGPLFQMCYRLISDNYLRYDFPVAWLPVSLRQIIEDGGVPQLYVGKIQIDPNTRTRVSVVLNPFELYMTHFATHLVDPWLQLRRPPEASEGFWDSVYIMLAEEYLSHFLPCAPGAQVRPHVPGPALAVPLVRHTPVRPADVPTIFRQSVLNQTNTPTSLHTSSVIQQNDPVDIWRSETVVQIFVDIWLSVGQTDSLQISPIRERGLALDHIRVVRSMIKHFHYFANSLTADMSTMDELKRVILGAVQGKIFLFLQHCMQHWPLDGSFRWVLELWLSFIQPWRYTEQRHRGGIERGPLMTCDIRIWSYFVAENLPAYTAIFHQLLPRFSRLDLPLPKNSYMLYRVTKVFSQPGLAQVLSELEKSFDPSADRSGPVPKIPNKWQGLIQHQHQQPLTEFENYQPLFSEPGISKVKAFILLVGQSIGTARLLAKEAEEHACKNLGFLSSFREFFSGSSATADIPLDERRKVVAYLDTSLQLLCSTFEIPRPDVPDVSTVTPISPIITPQDPLVSPSIRDWRQRRLIEYQGDPELQPIRSSEIAFLVKIGYQISSKLNEMYGSELAELYRRPGVVGRVMQRVLLPPQTIHSYERNTSGSRRFPVLVTQQLPPRLSLRRLGSRELVIWISVGALAFRLRGYHLLTFPVMVFIIWILLVLLRAALSSPTENRNTVSNISRHSPDLLNAPDGAPDVSP
ncbi:sphingomyelin phosphodiesterase 4 [Schistocerca gregaria]|uniref:sphingomyelin phosphodiesterase 4 n=1 Tax=Schistocerca gregaria TaxID=7010 RepID=UPI00211EAEE3|nr:sphingomyelin phosphodiesterase 4 [Schistocerca gregaria]